VPASTRTAKSLRSVVVTADDPRFLERQVEPATELVSLANLDVRQLRASYIERQRNFCTSPADPNGRAVRFFPGGFTIWSGMPGAGKTTLLRQLACHLLHKGQAVFVCSLEELPLDVFLRHACVALGTENPSEDGLQWCVDMWADKLKLWNYRPGKGDAEHQKIFAALRVLARDHGVRHAIIDSFMCLDVASNDFEGQRRFATTLGATCELSGAHVHLVAHPRKPSQASTDLDTADVAGAADLGRKADNVLFVGRSKDESASGDATPMRVSIKKQRYGTGYLGDCIGWFHRKHRQFVHDHLQEAPTHYLPDMAYERRIAAEPLLL
jgi:AAA domain